LALKTMTETLLRIEIAFFSNKKGLTA